jgi:hypothetical protein
MKLHVFTAAFERTENGSGKNASAFDEILDRAH